MAQTTISYTYDSAGNRTGRSAPGQTLAGVTDNPSGKAIPCSTISGVNWRNFGSKKKDNEEALSVNPIEFNWFDIALLLFPGPVLGELWGGLINRNIDNQKY